MIYIFKTSFPPFSFRIRKLQIFFCLACRTKFLENKHSPWCVWDLCKLFHFQVHQPHRMSQCWAWTALPRTARWRRNGSLASTPSPSLPHWHSSMYSSPACSSNIPTHSTPSLCKFPDSSSCFKVKHFQYLLLPGPPCLHHLKLHALLPKPSGVLLHRRVHILNSGVHLDFCQLLHPANRDSGASREISSYRVRVKLREIATVDPVPDWTGHLCE